jgi:hypothetical protein
MADYAMVREEQDDERLSGGVIGAFMTTTVCSVPLLGSQENQSDTYNPSTAVISPRWSEHRSPSQSRLSFFFNRQTRQDVQLDASWEKHQEHEKKKIHLVGKWHGLYGTVCSRSRGSNHQQTDGSKMADSDMFSTPKKD